MHIVHNNLFDFLHSLNLSLYVFDSCRRGMGSICVKVLMSLLATVTSVKSDTNHIVVGLALANTIELGIAQRKLLSKNDMYMDLPPDVQSSHLNVAYNHLKSKLGDEFNMRLYEIQNRIIRLQIWWKLYPRRSTTECTIEQYIRVESFDIDTWKTLQKQADLRINK